MTRPLVYGIPIVADPSLRDGELLLRRRAEPWFPMPASPVVLAALGTVRVRERGPDLPYVSMRSLRPRV